MKVLAQRNSDRAAPWIGRRFDLIGWMEILEFSAGNYLAIARILERIGRILGVIESDRELPDQMTQSTREALLKVRGHCELIGLTMSIKSIDRMSESIKTSNPKFSEAKIAIAEINQRIEDEIQDNLFLYIPKTHVAWYKSENLFGAEVQQSFPSTAYDIKEAGKCLALHRNTAAVCHLMRVLEIGLRTLAVKFNVPYENKPWNCVIEVAENRLKKIRAAKRKPKNWKTDEKFYSEAIAHFRFLKDAWRNYSMHVFERYDENQAESAFNHTKAFMRQLATKLKETP